MTNFPADSLAAPKQRANKQLSVHKILIFLLVLFAAIKLVIILVLPMPTLRASDLTADNILQAINSQRNARNLTTLNTNSMLSSAAQSKADDMQARHYFAHVDPDGNYIWPKIVAAGYTPYLQLGENLAIEFYDTESLVAAWMNSPTHRANILNDGFKDQGMGLNFGNSNSGQYYSVIANTFGTLLVSKKTQAQTPAPQPSSVAGTQTSVPSIPYQAPQPAVQPPPAKPKTASPKPVQKPASVPAAQPSPQTPAQPAPAPQNPPQAATPANGNPQPLAIRNPTDVSYATPEKTSSASPSSTLPALPAPSSEGVINSQTQSTEMGVQVNRYFTFAFGILLMLFLITDLRKMVDKRWELIDKKINNLALLVLSLIVIAVLYWL
jgi:outer membrane biosynthesis protein TonB